MKAKVTYIVKEDMLGFYKTKTKTRTVEIDRGLYENYDVAKIEKSAYEQLVCKENYDASIRITKIKIGSTEFIL